MIHPTRHRLAGLVLGLLAPLAAAPLAAAPVSIVQVGTFTTAPGGGNAGPQMNTGNKFVIRTTYDAAVTPASTRTINGLDFRVIDLAADGGGFTVDNGNSFDLLIPMEGFDTATPFVYSQNELNHFPFFRPTPQIIFTAVQTTNPGDPNNLPPVTDPGLSLAGAPDFVGYEFEGDFVAGAGNTFAELFVEVANLGGGNRAATYNNDVLDINTGIAIRGPQSPPAAPTVVLAQAVVAEAGPDIVFDAGNLDRTTDASSQNNNLGNARTDKEDFVTYDWTGPGGALVGADVDGTETDVIPGGGSSPRAVENVNKMVNIVNSGLTTTTDVVQWQVEVNEQLTGLGPSLDTTNVSYQNALPTIANASATAQGDDLLFDLAFDDVDLGVNVFIPDFELLDVTILVDAVDQTGFFSSLITGGSQLVTNADLLSQFGLGLHNFEVAVTDRAGAFAAAFFQFDVLQGPQGVPEPATAALLGLGLAGMLAGLRRRGRAAR